MKLLQETLEKKDKEMRALQQQNAELESHLKQLLTVQISDEHQLQNYMDTLHDLVQSEECLEDAEEECPTHMNLHEEVSSRRTPPTTAGLYRAGPIMVSINCVLTSTPIMAMLSIHYWLIGSMRTIP